MNFAVIDEQQTSKRFSVDHVPMRAQFIDDAEYIKLIQRDGILKHNNCLSYKIFKKDKIVNSINLDDFADIAKVKGSSSNIQLVFNESKIWITPVNTKKIAVQWHLPISMQRNCLDIFNDNKTCFVLRIYQNFSTSTGWKKTQRTLEFEIDVSRRSCYINLESNSDSYIAELGILYNKEKYIFITRSEEVTLPRNESITNKINFHKISKNLNYNWKCNRHIKLTDYIPYKIVDSNESLRDIIAEVKTSAVYGEFINEGSKVFRLEKNKINPSSVSKRKNAVRKFNAVKNKKMLLNNDNLKDGLPLITNISNNETITYSKSNAKNKYQIAKYQSNDSLVLNNKQVEYKIDIKNEKITKKISTLKDKAEIILRGKVKRKGQRVRVGGLLIEPEEDGTFCVACVIRNGRLYVPVDEVDVITKK